MDVEALTIIGAGMGGLTAALALQRVGFKVSLYEQAPALAEVGAGFTVGPNAMRGLDYVDLGSSVRAAASIVNENAVRHWRTNDVIDNSRLGYEAKERAGSGNLYYHIHRVDMHDILADAVRTNDSDCIILGHEFTVLEQLDSEVIVRFKNGVQITTELLIGSDGAQSSVRQHAFSDAPPQFGGSVAYRGLVPIKDLDPAIVRSGAQLSIGPQQMFMRYPIRKGTLLNYVGNVATDEWKEEGWNRPSDISEVMRYFEDWHDEVTSIIRATPEGAGIKWAIVHRPPLSSWVNGRVTLVGDVAHPLSPFLGSGAALAMEDGVVLGRCFEAADSVEEALALYDRARIERATWIQLESQRQADRFMEVDPDQFDATTTADIHERIREYDPATVPLI